MSEIAPDLASAKLTLAKKYRGTQCSGCGNSVRYYRGGGCVECAKRRTAKWQKENPEVGRDRARRHYQKVSKAKTAWANYCAHSVRTLCKDLPVEQALKLEPVRDLLLAWGAVEQPATTQGFDDAWGGL